MTSSSYGDYLIGPMTDLWDENLPVDISPGTKELPFWAFL